MQIDSVGLIKPHWLKLPDRKSVLIYIGSAFAVMTILVYFVAAPGPEPKDIVYNSEFDGSVRQVERYLNQNLKDPHSLEVIHWYPVHKIGDGFAVQVKYRSKNSFGGYVVDTYLFQLDQNGNIYSYVKTE